MASELKTININQINQVDSIQNGYFILLETQAGTRLIDYQNFVIGLDNITFSPLLSAVSTTISTISAQLFDLSLDTTASFVSVSSILTSNVNEVGTNVSNLTTIVNNLTDTVNNISQETDQNALDISSLSSTVIDNNNSNNNSNNNIINQIAFLQSFIATNSAHSSWSFPP